VLISILKIDPRDAAINNEDDLTEKPKISSSKVRREVSLNEFSEVVDEKA